MNEKEMKRQSVRNRYAKTAGNQGTGCGCSSSASSCCSNAFPADAVSSEELGYTKRDLSSVPQGADLGLGCGNPQALAKLKEGETVIDLGSGAGFDCFLAARKVGKTGKVIGIDMTPEMIDKAREHAEKGTYTNVEFRLGQIEHIPAADNTADVIISNCVINLSPDKQQVFQEAFRILKPGGRLAVSDVVAAAELPESVLNDMELYASCISGATQVEQLFRMMEEAGFTNISITPMDSSRSFIKKWAPGSRVEDYVLSASIEAEKPR